MNLKDYLDTEQLRSHVASGLVTAVQHPTQPLLIFTYSRQAVFDDIWDDITIKCRGLIVDGKGEVVARAFEKFFNIEQMDRPETWLSNLPTERPQVLEKLDGSLGIFYQYGGEVGIASKGSFSSDHAKWATAHYKAHHAAATWPEGWTPIFEMICESIQTHVVHYGIADELVLLALVNTATGEEASYHNLHYWGTANGFRIVDVYDMTVGDTVTEDRSNREGYVLSWPRSGKTPLKVKVKHESFLKMQKIAHAATPKAILEALMEGNSDLVDTWTTTAHPELAAFVRKWSAEYRARYGVMLQTAARLVLHARNRFDTRKDQAEFFLNDNCKFLSPLCFAYLDGKSKETISKIAWKLVRDHPAPDAPLEPEKSPFVTDDELDGDENKI